MSEQTTTCRVCGCELEGRDVYEGICGPCREEEILAGTKVRKRPTKRAPRSTDGIPTPHSPIPTAPPIDMDADTKELLAVEEPAPVPTTPPSPTTATPGSTIQFAEFPTPKPPPPPPDVSDTSGTDAAVVPADLDDELQVLEPSHAPTTSQPQSSQPESPLPRDEPEPPAFDLGFQKTDAPEPPAPSPPEPEPLHEPEPSQPADAGDTTLDFAFAELADEPEPNAPASEPEPAAPPRPAPSPPAPTTTDVSFEPPPPHADMAAQIARLQKRLDDVAARLDAPSGPRTGHPPIAFGIKACFGFVLGLGILAAVGIGLTALAGKLFYPPALDFLRRMAALLGG